MFPSTNNAIVIAVVAPLLLNLSQGPWYQASVTFNSKHLLTRPTPILVSINPLLAFSLNSSNNSSTKLCHNNKYYKLTTNFNLLELM